MGERAQTPPNRTARTLLWPAGWERPLTRALIVSDDLAGPTSAALAICEVLWRYGLRVRLCAGTAGAVQAELAAFPPEVIFPTSLWQPALGGPPEALAALSASRLPAVGSPLRPWRLAQHRLDLYDKWRALGLGVPAALCLLPEGDGTWRELGQPAPGGVVVDGQPNFARLVARLAPPLVLRRVVGGSWTQCLVCHEATSFAEGLGRCAAAGGPVLVEAYGPQAGPSVIYAVGVLEEAAGGATVVRPLPVGQLWREWSGAPEESTPSERQHGFGRLSADLEGRLQQAARLSFESLGCRGYARFDFALDQAGRPWPLQVTLLPGLAPTDRHVFPAAARAGGLSYEALIAQLVLGACRPGLPPARLADPPPRAAAVGGAPTAAVGPAPTPGRASGQAHPRPAGGRPTEAPTTVGAVAECLLGARAVLPLAVGVIPFIALYGLLARRAGFSPLAIQVVLAVCYSGMTLIGTKLLLTGIPLPLIGLTGAVLNARHLLYSAALAPYLAAHLSRRARVLLSYLLSDEAFAVCLPRFQAGGAAALRQWYFLGAGLLVWLAAQGAALLGGTLGQALPPGWSLDFTATLSFVGLLALALKDRASLVAATLAGGLAVLCAGLPLNLGLLLAVGLGLAGGSVAGRLTSKRRLRRQKGTPDEWKRVAAVPAAGAGDLWLPGGISDRELAPAPVLAAPGAGPLARRPVRGAGGAGSAPARRAGEPGALESSADRWSERLARGAPDQEAAGRHHSGDGVALAAQLAEMARWELVGPLPPTPRGRGEAPFKLPLNTQRKGTRP